MLMAFGSLSGCGPSTAGKEPAPSPREAISKAIVAVFVNGDAEAAAKAFIGKSDAMEMIKTMATFSHAQKEFREAFLAAYGAEAWKKFQDPNHDPGGGNFRFTGFDDSVLKDLETIKIDERDKEAFLRFQAMNPARLRKDEW